MVLIRRSFTELGEGDPVQLGRFRLLALLSSGGYGDVFLGQNEQGDLAAIKVPRQRGEPDPRAFQRFRREVGLYMGVSSRFTPSFTAADLSADQPWMATEFIDGSTLREVVRNCAPLHPQQLIPLAELTAEALRDIHSNGVIHRDFNPNNVILTDAQPWVIDFGIGRGIKQGSLDTGRLLGSPGFMSPEQVRGERALQPSDIFTWAETVCFAASGRSPFEGDESEDVDRNIENVSPRIPDLPEPLDELVASALSRSPDARPTADQIVARLGELPIMPSLGDPEGTINLEMRGWSLPDWMRGEQRPVPERPSTTGVRGRLRGPVGWLAVAVGLTGLVLATVLVTSALTESEGRVQLQLEDLTKSIAEMGEILTPDLEGAASESDSSSGVVPDSSDAQPSAPSMDDGSNGGSAPSEVPLRPGCAEPGSALKIGIFVPETGESVDLVQPVKLAVQRAVEMVNASGGVNGEPVELVAVDEGDQLNLMGLGEVAAAVDVLLCDQQVSAVIGPFWPASLNRGLDPGEASAVERIVDWPAVVCSPISWYRFHGDGRGLFISTVATRWQIAGTLADLVWTEGSESVAIVGSAFLLDNDLTDGFIPAFRERGGEVVYQGSASLIPGRVDDADAIVVDGSDHLSTGGVFALLHENGITTTSHKIYVAFDANYDSATSTHLEAIGIDPASFAGTQWLVVDQFGPWAAELYEIFQQSEPNIGFPLNAAHAYDCVDTIALAAVEAGSNRPERFQSNLVTVTTGGDLCIGFPECAALIAEGVDVDFWGLSSLVDLTENGDNLAARILVVESQPDGSVIQGDMISPLQYRSP